MTLFLASAQHLHASVGSSFQNEVLSGPLLLAVPVALIAGVVSFLSPCVLPLVPGYLSYVTGLSGADIDASRGPRRGRHGAVLAGSILFVLGFSVVFVTSGALFGYAGTHLTTHTVVVDRILGVVMVVLGLAFMGFVPALEREMRFHRLPAAGVAGAPILGFLFGVGWTPCIGPTLGAVQSLALSGSSATQGALLTLVYCLGLGLPFIAVALLFRRAVGVLAVVKRHYALVTRIGGVMLIAVGVLLLTGTWHSLVGDLQSTINGYVPAV